MEHKVEKNMKKESPKKLLAISVLVVVVVLLSITAAFAATPIVTAPVNLGAAGDYAITFRAASFTGVTVSFAA